MRFFRTWAFILLNEEKSELEKELKNLREQKWSAMEKVTELKRKIADFYEEIKVKSDELKAVNIDFDKVNVVSIEWYEGTYSAYTEVTMISKNSTKTLELRLNLTIPEHKKLVQDFSHYNKRKGK